MICCVPGILQLSRECRFRLKPDCAMLPASTVGTLTKRASALVTMARLTRWVGTSIDIEERKRWEADISRAREAAEAASIAKSAFLANMSHEIRTPLGVIIGFTDLLMASGGEGDERSTWLRMIKRNGEVLHDLINELLDLSKVEADRLEVELAQVSLAHFIRDTAAVVAFKAREKGIALRFEVGSEVPALVDTDAVRLRQILLNVVGNAIKFTDRGGVDVVIRYVEIAETARGRLEFEVRDTGIGLSPEQAKRIWAPFAQADCSTARKYGGTGLGLTLAKRLAIALGGDLHLASSQLGAGSVFVFCIDAGTLRLSEGPVLPAGCDILKADSTELDAGALVQAEAGKMAAAAVSNCLLAGHPCVGGG